MRAPVPRLPSDAQPARRLHRNTPTRYGHGSLGRGQRQWREEVPRVGKRRGWGRCFACRARRRVIARCCDRVVICASVHCKLGFSHGFAKLSERGGSPKWTALSEQPGDPQGVAILAGLPRLVLLPDTLAALACHGNQSVRRRTRGPVCSPQRPATPRRNGNSPRSQAYLPLGRGTLQERL